NKYQRKISHIIVDEAHCIDTWGNSFRTDYQRLDTLRAILPNAKVVAMTATATKTTQKCIAKHLRFCANYYLVSASCDRPNLFYSVNKRSSHNSVNKTSEDAYGEVLRPILMELKVQNLYHTTANDVLMSLQQMQNNISLSKTSIFLQEKGRSFPKTVLFSKLKWCGYGHELAFQIMGDEELHCYTSNSQYTARLGQYHAPQVDALKQELSCIFKSPNSHVRLLLATEAYSMGTDAPDIRRVIHIGPPSTLETYLQETGRAGRDGEHAEAIMYMNKSDIASNVKHLSKEMKDFCTTSKCRRQTLMNYFEFECVQPEPGHRCCDNCSKTCQCAECIIHKVFETDFHLSTQESNEQIPAPRKAGLKWLHSC
ncbi:ATP-dependent DNA helicase Q1-like, partial [Haliotis rubra]|uniref:ATP-dependent DNA helicase Q1-like n=1 Tax=Haliotis rubra TaxID=36100 RepID=UPI001EE518BA